MKTLIIILLSITLTCQGQNDLKYAAYNVVSSSIIGGIGNCITHGKFNGKNFIKGAGKGSVAGSLIFISKQMLYNQSNKDNFSPNWKMVWSSRLLNSTGNCILRNSILDEGWLNNFSFNIGFIRLNINKNHPVQIDPLALLSTTGMFIMGGKFDFKKTAICGIPTFTHNNVKISIDTIKKEGTATPSPLGMSLCYSIYLYKGLKGSDVMMHEIIHSYQRENLMNVNRYFTIYNKHEDFKFIHNDLSTYDFLYLLQNITIGYNNNLFEIEANHFSKTDSETKFKTIVIKL